MLTQLSTSGIEMINLVSLAGVACASGITILLHSPHDVVDSIGIGYRPGKKPRMFGVVRENLLRDDDNGEWKRINVGLGAFRLSSLVVSPNYASDQTLFVASLGGGIFRSTDGGDSWSAINEGLADSHVDLLCISPDFHLSRTLFALGRSGVVYRSDDAGGAWRTAWAPKQPVSGEIAARGTSKAVDLLQCMAEARANFPGASSIAIAGDAIVVGASDGELYASKDGGGAWERIGALPTPARITCIEVPDGGSVQDAFFVGTDTAGVFRVLAGGGRIEPTQQHKALTNVTALGSTVDGEGRRLLMACSWTDGLFVSKDDGQSWTLESRGLTKDRQAEEPPWVGPHFRNIAVLETDGSRELLVGGFDGLFRRPQDGERWRSIETLPIGIVIGLAVGPADAAGKRTLFITTYSAGVYALELGSDEWRILNGGLDTLRLTGLRFSPDADPEKRVLFTGNYGAVLRWNGAEGGWRSTPLTPGSVKRNTLARMTRYRRMAEKFMSRFLNAEGVLKVKQAFRAGMKRVRPAETRGLSAWAFASAFQFSPQYDQDGTLFVGTREHGVFRSSDRGDSFIQLWDGNGLYCHSLAIVDDGGPPRKLYASSEDGLWCSFDAGASWARVETGLPFRSARIAIRKLPGGGDVFFVGGGEGLLRSVDGGAQWAPAPLGEGAEKGSIGALALSPTFETDGCMVVYVNGWGLYGSRDGGLTFERFNPKNPINGYGFTPPLNFPDASNLIEFSPDFAKDGTIFAAAYDDVFMSSDWGKTWRRFPKPTRYEDSRAELVFTGGWMQSFDQRCSAGSVHSSATAGDSVLFTFAGNRITWVGPTGPDHGMADVFVDGALSAQVDLFDETPQYGKTLFTAELAQGEHDIRIVIGDAKNARSTGRRVSIDAFDIC